MPTCQPIAMLELDDESLQGIKRIGRLKESAILSSAILSGGKVTLLIFKQSHAEVLLNIATTDWELFAAAMKALPQAYNNEIINEANYQQLSHQNDYKQKQFWQGVAGGCSEVVK